MSRSRTAVKGCAASDPVAGAHAPDNAVKLAQLRFVADGWKSRSANRRKRPLEWTLFVRVAWAGSLRFIKGTTRSFVARGVEGNAAGKESPLERERWGKRLGLAFKPPREEAQWIF